MKSKIYSSIFVILALIILIYDICAGDQIANWIFVCIGLLVIAQLINIFGKQKTQQPCQK